jgi:hypothetical protein
MQRVCAGTPAHHAQTMKERVARPGRRMRRECTDTLAYQEHALLLSLQEKRSGQASGRPGCRECVRVHWYSMSKQSHALPPVEEGAAPPPLCAAATTRSAQRGLPSPAACRVE